MKQSKEVKEFTDELLRIFASIPKAMASDKNELIKAAPMLMDADLEGLEGIGYGMGGTGGFGLISKFLPIVRKLKRVEFQRTAGRYKKLKNKKKIMDFIEALDADSLMQQDEAAEALKAIESDIVPASLRKILQGVEDPGNTPLLQRAVKSKYLYIRRIAAETLLYAGEPLRMNLLTVLLQDKNYRVRIAAVHSLGIIGNKRALQLLKRTVYQSSEHIKPWLEEKEQFCMVKSAAVEALGTFKKDDVRDILIKTLRDSFIYVQASVEQVFMSWNDPELVAPLLKMLNDDLGNLCRCNAASILGKMKAKAAVKPLCDMLNDGPLELSAAAWALVQIGDTRAIKPLLSVLHTECDAVKALGAFKDERAIQPLIAALNSPDFFIQREASRALLRYDKGQVPKELIKDIKNTDSSTKGKTLLALTDSNYSFIRHQALKRLIELDLPEKNEALINVWSDKDYNIRETVVEALGPVKTAQARKMLFLALFRGATKGISNNAKEALRYRKDVMVDKELMEFADNDDPDFRMLAIDVLGRRRKKTAFKAITTCLYDEDSRVQAEAVVALGRCDTKNAWKEIVEFQKFKTGQIRRNKKMTAAQRTRALSDLERVVGQAREQYSLERH